MARAAYDDIGNRQWAARDGDRDVYTANDLNQYVDRTVTGVVWVTGEARSNAVIKVNSNATERHGEYFAKKLAVDNASQAAYASLQISGVGSNGATVTTNTANGHAFTPATPEVFGYDLDGNQTNDGRWVYTWDGENRLNWICS